MKYWVMLSSIRAKDQDRMHNQAAVLYAPHDIRLEERGRPTLPENLPRDFFKLIIL